MEIRDYIEHLRSKPEHVRRQIALSSSMVITGIVVVGWLIALGTSGTLALSSSPTPEVPDISTTVSNTKNSFSDLLGAAGAYQQTAGTGDAPLMIVNAKASSTLDSAPDTTEGKTVIPF